MTIRHAAVLTACMLLLDSTVAPAWSSAATTPPTARPGASNAWTEVLTLLRREWLFAPTDASLEGLRSDDGDQLQALLSSRDVYASYLSRDAFEKVRMTQRPEYAGIGLELQKGPSREVTCFPIEGGPAAQAGIQPGEQLLAVGGQRVHDKPLLAVAALAAGPLGSTVSLELSDRGRVRVVAIRRAAIRASSVRKLRYGSLDALRIASFATNTRDEIAFLLSTVDARAPLILDLRGNGGGDFHAAVDAAMLFVAPGDPIVTLRGRNSVRQFENTMREKQPARSLVVWQDSLTASAAEVFIGALTADHRARSVGSKSFGKGTRQDIFELANGDVLIITIGTLQTPGHVAFDGQGLEADVPVPPGAATTAYLSRTLALFPASKPGGKPSREAIPTPGRKSLEATGAKPGDTRATTDSGTADPNEPTNRMASPAPRAEDPPPSPEP